jgi:hypothetical protein
LTIQGLPTQSVIYGGNSRVFGVAAGVSVTLTNLTVTGGTAIADSLNAIEDSTFGFGGGIYNAGTLTLSGCTVYWNTAANGFTTATQSTASGYGGGIYNTGTLTVSGCTLSHNSAQFGGGIYNEYGATLTVRGSTLSYNSAQSGGGIYSVGPIPHKKGGGMMAIGSSLFSNNAGGNVFGSYVDQKGNTFL